MSVTEAACGVETLDITPPQHVTNEDFLLAKTSFYKDRRRASDAGMSESTDEAPLDIVDFMTIAQWRNVDYLAMTWNPGQEADPQLIGGTANIQESMVDIELSLACKRIHRENFFGHDKGQAMRLLLNELTILGHPLVRDHDAIARLEGICWDIQGDDILPVLVFKKAPHGDLRRFIRTAAGRAMSFEARLRLCSEIGAAIMTLHALHIIHGDIKPENILIFEKTPGVYSAKLADFGYSCLNLTRDAFALMVLPMSWPWTAPEVSKDDCILTFISATRADHFSFGMLCLWLLFTNDISPSLEGDEDLQRLAELKEGDGLRAFALELVSKRPSDAPHPLIQLEGLNFFFSWTLHPDPASRGLTKDLWSRVEKDFIAAREALRLGETAQQNLTLVSAMGIEYEDRVFRIRHPFGHYGFYPNHIDDVDLGYDINDITFNLSKALGQIATADFRLWNELQSCLANHALDEGRTDDGRANASFDLSLLFAVGFGHPDDAEQEEEGSEWLKRSGKTREDLDAQLEELKAMERIGYGSTDVMNEVIDHTEQYRRDGILEEATRVYERTVKRLTVVFDAWHPILRRVIIELLDMWLDQGEYEKAEAILPSLVADLRAHLSPTAVDTFVIEHNLATIRTRQGRFDEAIALQEDLLRRCTMALGTDNRIALAVMGSLGSTYVTLGQWDTAEPLQSQNYAVNLKHRGADHPRTLAAASNLAATYEGQGRLGEAAELKLALLEAHTRVLGDDHTRTMVIMGNLANNYRMQAKWDDSEQLELRVLAVRRRLYGDGHQATLMSMGNLASTYTAQRRFAEALEMDTAVASAFTQQLGPRHPIALTARNNLAVTLWELGRKEEAVGIMTEVARLRVKILGDHNKDAEKSVARLAAWQADMRLG